MSIHHTTLQIPIGGTYFEFDAVVEYKWSEPLSATYFDPACGGVEIVDVRICHDLDYVSIDWDGMDISSAINEIRGREAA